MNGVASSPLPHWFCLGVLKGRLQRPVAVATSLTGTGFCVAPFFISRKSLAGNGCDGWDVVGCGFSFGRRWLLFGVVRLLGCGVNWVFSGAGGCFRRLPIAALRLCNPCRRFPGGSPSASLKSGHKELEKKIIV